METIHVIFIATGKAGSGACSLGIVPMPISLIPETDTFFYYEGTHYIVSKRFTCVVDGQSLMALLLRKPMVGEGGGPDIDGMLNDAKLARSEVNTEVTETPVA